LCSPRLTDTQIEAVLAGKMSITLRGSSKQGAPANEDDPSAEIRQIGPEGDGDIRRHGEVTTDRPVADFFRAEGQTPLPLPGRSSAVTCSTGLKALGVAQEVVPGLVVTEYRPPKRISPCYLGCYLTLLP
jgi:hypothetical protein